MFSLSQVFIQYMNTDSNISLIKREKQLDTIDGIGSGFVFPKEIHDMRVRF